MCKAANLESAAVYGHIHEFDHFEEDTIYRDEHAWSAVKIDGSWELFDLTYASGGLVRKKQYFRRFLFYTIHIPYTVKFKFRKSFNSSWFFVDPREMILSHQPNISDFQLLETPVPIEVFEDKTKSIREHTEAFPAIVRKSSGTARFQALSEFEKWKFEGNEGAENNPNNHRIKGFNYFLMADSIFRSTYKPKEKRLVTDTLKMLELNGYCRISDSAFYDNKLDNNREYLVKKARSENWKKERHKNDNAFIKHLNQRIAANKKLIRIQKKLKTDHHKLTGAYNRSLKRNDPFSILKIARSRKDAPANRKKPDRSFLFADSLFRKAQTLLLEKDSLFVFMLRKISMHFTKPKKQIPKR